MSKPKLTPWFPASVKPVHRGEYEVYRKDVYPLFPNQTKILWTGTHWVHTAESSLGRFIGAIASVSGRNKWRGLAEKPQ